MDDPRRPLILIPAHNEEGRIGRVLVDIKHYVPQARIVVIDDGSQDGTTNEARRLGVTVIRLPFNLGYGSALQTGYLYARRLGAQHVVQMDADGQHDPCSLPAMLSALGDGHDVVVGSRYLSTSPPKTSLCRWLGTKLFSWIVTQWTGIRVTDPTSGFQALSAHAVAFLAQDGFPEDYPDADVLILLAREGLSLVEIPVQMHPRIGGVSMHRGSRAAYYAYKMFLTLGLLGVRRKSPFRQPLIPRKDRDTNPMTQAS